MVKVKVWELCKYCNGKIEYDKEYQRNGLVFCSKKCADDYQREEEAELFDCQED